MAVTKLRNGRWICYWKEKKKNKRVYFGRGPGAEADAIAFNQQLGLKRRRPTAKNSIAPTFIHLAQSYLKVKPLSENSLRCLEKRLKQILPTFGNTKAMGLSYDQVDQYVTRRLQKVKASTVGREIDDVQAILNWAARRKPPLIPYNPIAKYEKPKRNDEAILPPNPIEIERMLLYAPPHLYRALTILYYTGIRPGQELFGLTWHDIDWENNVILVRSARKGGPVKRFVPIMHQEFRDLLESWKQDEGFIIQYKGKPVKSLRKSFARAKKKAGIQRRMRLYDLRHAFASLALKRGGDLKAISEIMGHSRPDTTARIYQHVDRAMHQEAVSKLPSLNLLPEKPKA